MSWVKIPSIEEVLFESRDKTDHVVNNFGSDSDIERLMRSSFLYCGSFLDQQKESARCN